MMKFSTVFLVVALVCCCSYATTYYVPSQFPTIQLGVSAAQDGDTVMVAAGTYYENVTISNSIYLLGEDMYTTIIDANGYGQVILVPNYPGSYGQISGFTLTGSGQGVAGSYACAGLVIHTMGSGNWLVSWNYFRDNPDNGYLSFDGGTVERCIFENNSYAGSYRRTLFASSYSNLEVYHCDFKDNYRSIYTHSAASSFTGKNNIVTDGTIGIEMNITNYTLEYNDVWNNTTNYSGCLPGTGDLNADPLYIGGTPFDYHLQPGSPCIDAGDPMMPPDPDATVADMGVYYFDQGAFLMIVDLTYRSGSPVPPNGGNLYFDVYAENVSSTALDFDAWLEAAYEGGTPTTLVQRYLTNFLPGWAIDRENTYYPVPGSWLAGNYTMAGKVGDHPDDAWDEDSFPWSKSGDDQIGGFVPFPVAGAPNPFDDIKKPAATLPEEFEVLTCYPNPFNPETQLTFSLSDDAVTSLIVYDVTGRAVTALFDGYYPAGLHEITFNGEHLPSGVYFARLTTGDQVQTRKLVLMK